MPHPKLVVALQRILRDGPVDDAVLVERLEQHGWRRTDSSEVWLACKEHGLAELVDGRWVPRGWAEPQQEVPKRSRPGDSARAGGTDGLAPKDRVELERLRREIRLDRSRESAVVDASDAWTRFAQEAVRALGDELAAVSKQRTTTDVPLSDGRVVSRGETRMLLRFDAESDVVAREGLQATLIVGEAQFEAEVISIFGSEVTLSLPLDTPDARSAKLRCDLSWLLSAQARRFGELAGGAAGFDPDAALAMVEMHDPEPRDVPSVAFDGLNAEQSRAVAMGLTDGVTWLWGPPGTGKTTTLAVLLAQLHQRGLRTLVVAPTNTAVDIALQGALRRLGDFPIGDVVRVGQPVDATLIGRDPVPILVDEVAAVRGEAVAARRVQVAESVRQMRKRVGEIGPDDARTDELSLALAEATALMRGLDALMAEVRVQVCRDARLVAATAHQLVMSTLSGIAFDVVVIDEASMMPTALAALAAGAGTGHTVVAGDFRQLPPVVIADSAAARRVLARSAFESAGVTGAVLGGRPPVNLVALVEQYRMPEHVSEAIADGFYPENRLSTAELVKSRPPTIASALDAAIVCVDTGALRTRVARRGGVTSRYNLMNALVAAAFVDDQTEAGATPALISPFAPQARLLESLVWADGSGGVASTVHRFQGGETDVVLFDSVDAAGGGMRRHRWFEEGADGSEGARLVNVAMSRCRERLVIVGDVPRIRRHNSSDDAIGRFLRAALAEAHFVQPRQLLRDQLAATLDVERLRADIERASGAIEVWSRRIDLDVILALAPSLRAAAVRDVTTSIWYEPGRDDAVPDALDPLLRSEVMLRPLLPVRESHAVIGDVVWASSEALLSPAPGAVIRRDDPGLAEAVLRMTRRRSFHDNPGTGAPAARCGCGRPLVRDERWRVGSVCLACDAKRSVRAGRR
jgi:hypothetical protein